MKVRVIGGGVGYLTEGREFVISQIRNEDHVLGYKHYSAPEFPWFPESSLAPINSEILKAIKRYEEIHPPQNN